MMKRIFAITAICLVSAFSSPSVAFDKLAHTFTVYWKKGPNGKYIDPTVEVFENAQEQTFELRADTAISYRSTFLYEDPCAAHAVGTIASVRAVDSPGDGLYVKSFEAVCYLQSGELSEPTTGVIEVDKVKPCNGDAYLGDPTIEISRQFARFGGIRFIAATFECVREEQEKDAVSLDAIACEPEMPTVMDISTEMREFPGASRPFTEVRVMLTCGE